MKMKGERDPAYAILYVEGLAPGRFQPLLWCFHLFRLFHSILVFSTPFSAKRLRLKTLKTCTFVRALGCGYLRLQFIREIFLRSGMRALGSLGDGLPRERQGFGMHAECNRRTHRSPVRSST